MDKVTNEELARMIAKGFDHVDERLNQTATKNDIGVLSGRLDHLDARVGRIEADIHEMRGNIVFRQEFEDLMGRVKYLETKMKIESGK